MRFPGFYYSTFFFCLFCFELLRKSLSDFFLQARMYLNDVRMIRIVSGQVLTFLKISTAIQARISPKNITIFYGEHAATLPQAHAKYSPVKEEHCSERRLTANLKAYFHSDVCSLRKSCSSKCLNAVLLSLGC